MAMSLKKIGAIAVGGAMVATALASGVAAEVTTSGFTDYKELKDILVKDGQPNCYVVVGANAPSTMDVVSAADIAAKIGSLCYKEGTVEDGSATIKVSAKAESDDEDIYNLDSPNEDVVLVAASDSDYADGFINGANPSSNVETNTVKINSAQLDLQNKNTSDDFGAISLGDVSTMLKVDDIDPSDWYDSDDDAGEVVFAKIKYDSDDKRSIDEDQMLYASIAYKNDEDVFNSTNVVYLKPGMRIPFLGEEYAVVKIDDDDDTIYIGKEAFDGVMKAGETYPVGNGYEVKVANVLKDNNKKFKVEIQILKDGHVVAKKFDVVDPNANQTLELVYKDVGVVVHSAWMDVSETYGYAELLITKDTKALELGEEYMPDWEAWACVLKGDDLDIVKDLDSGNKDKLIGIALKYVGDKKKKLDDGDKVDIANYVKLVFDDEDKDNTLKAKFMMDESKEVTLDIGQKVSALNAEVKLNDIKANAVEPVALTAPIAKLDTEVSLDTADKNLVLVGGPVANKLTKELVDAGKLTLGNDSPATIAVLPGEANGHDVVVVAGGDREKTREAALELIKML